MRMPGPLVLVGALDAGVLMQRRARNPRLRECPGIGCNQAQDAQGGVSGKRKREHDCARRIWTRS